MKIVVFTILFLVFANSSYSQSSGNISTSIEHFEDALNPKSSATYLTLTSELEGKYSFDSSLVKWHVKAIQSENTIEKEYNNYINLKEAYYRYRNQNLKFSLGQQVLNWSSTEAFHPSDLINSFDYNLIFDGNEKLGQPLTSLSYKYESFIVELLYFPYLIAPRQFKFPLNRLSAPIGKAIWLDENSKPLESNTENQYGISLQASLSSFDARFFYLNHYDRTHPIFLPSITGIIHPNFQKSEAYGLIFEKDFEEVVLKIEGVTKNFDTLEALESLPQVFTPKSHSQLALGMDYGFSHESGKDSTFILEYQKVIHDQIDIARQLSLFQNDILLGYRLSLNDLNGTEILASIINDLDNIQENLTKLEYKTRLTDFWKVKVGALALNAPQKASLQTSYLNSYDQTSKFSIEFSRQF